MKGRESGMPEQHMWETFFDIPKILESLEITSSLMTVVELGAGDGTFTIPVAKRISGNIIAFDIERDLITQLKQRAQQDNLSNIQAELRDFVDHGMKLQDSSADYVMAFNLLHIESPVALLQETYRILKVGGKLGIIHWNYDPSTPRGPSIAIRPKPEQCINWATQAGFNQLAQTDLKPYHYGLLFQK